MKKYFIFLLAIFAFCFSCTGQNEKSIYLVEAEAFQFRGGWLIDKTPGNKASGNAILRVMSGKTPAPDALTQIEIKTAGIYTVWVRSADYPNDKPGTRLFQLWIDDAGMKESGKHGADGYGWEKAGVVTVSTGQHILRLKDTKVNFARCDAILLALNDQFDPAAELASLQQYRINPVTVKASPVTYPSLEAPVMVTSGAKEIAAIGNDHIRLRFVTSMTGNNKRLIAKTDIKQGADWINMNSFYEDHKIYLLSSQRPDLTYGTFFPSWNGSKGFTSIEANGKQISILEPGNAMNPFLAGELNEAVPVSAAKINSNAIEVQYKINTGATITGVWTIDKNNQHINIRLKYNATYSGFYSLGIAAFQSIPQEKMTNILLPPMFQYKRLSPQPVMLSSAMMQQPVAIAEAKLSSGSFSTFVSGDTASFPLEWGSAYSSPMGFTIKNETNNIQPVAFSPVLGLPDSKIVSGQMIERDFVVGAIGGGWNEALEYISDKVYKVKDYRVQQGSITDAVFNMIDLIKNDDAAGWDPELKGFYDIEANPASAATVVQSSPLTMISAAVLTKDEDFYITRALPTIEYTLSRSGFRWAKGVVAGGFNNTRKSLLLSPFNSQFTTAYYEGLYQLLGQSNPWLLDIALPGNSVRKANGYSVNIPVWVQELAAYRLTRDKSWLDLATTDATKFISTQVYSNTTTPVTSQPFYNSSVYAYWWDLLDLYEQTKEERFLKAAEAGAFQTIAGIRSFPLVKNSLQVIHKNNKFEGNTTMWWKKDKKYRLGFPRIAGDATEETVPQSLVSPVGLGFEQPYTYFDPGKTVRPVFMSNWAPHLLRLFQYTKRPIFNTYARNGIIGRFTNYPGYYASGFTDITMRPDFPYKGPDVSSIYYHHIPPHLAFTLDYLVTEATQRSGQNISFPYGKQDGFVWFTNRLFGAGKGNVFDDKEARLYLKKGLVTLNTASVNYITAISNDRLWLILLNESANDLPVTAKIDTVAGIIKDAAALLYTERKSKPIAVSVKNNTAGITIKGKGFAALSFPLHKKMVETFLPVVKNGMKQIDMGEPWGKVYIFRIRSPFGWDSIYGFSETAPLTGATATVSLGAQSIAKQVYPYEWSFITINADETVSVNINLKTADGITIEKTVTMEGIK